MKPKSVLASVTIGTLFVAEACGRLYKGKKLTSSQVTFVTGLAANYLTD